MTNILSAMFLSLCLIGSVHANDYIGAYNYPADAGDVARDTSAFDGGSGSTSNTSAQSYPVGDVPDVGPSGPVDTSEYETSTETTTESDE